MKTYTVYALISPENNEPYYVGMTVNIRHRIYEHFGGKRGCQDKSDFINDLKAKGYKPLFSILEQDIEEKEIAESFESKYIAEYRSKGFILFNKNNGGNKPPIQNRKYTAEEKHNRMLISPLKKAVVQLTKQGVFVTEYLGTREAGRITGIDHRSISQVAAGSKIRKTAGGYKWIYKES